MTHVQADTSYSIVNGEVCGPVRNDVSLLDWLREDAGAADVRRACESGHCGTCVVELDGLAVKSCSVMMDEAMGREVVTLSGLRRSPRPTVHALLQVLDERKPFQCGYCKPAFVWSAIELLEKNQRPTEHDVRDAFSGLLCRCTGYQEIVEAVLVAARDLQEAGTVGGA